MSIKTSLTCPVCSITYSRLGHLIRHGKRKHHIDLSNYDGSHPFDRLRSETNNIKTSEIENNQNSKEEIKATKTEEIHPSEKSSQQPSKLR